MRVLFVDDEPEIREITRSTLEAAGYEVLLAADGAEALALQALHPEVALAVVDIHMPVMDGVVAIRGLLRANPALKVVAVSGYSTYEGVVREAGAGWFLVKPYTANALLGALDSAVAELEAEAGEGGRG